MSGPRDLRTIQWTYLLIVTVMVAVAYSVFLSVPKKGVEDTAVLLLALVDEWQDLEVLINIEAPGPMRSTRRALQAAILSRISSEIEDLSESEVPFSVIRFIFQLLYDERSA